MALTMEDLELQFVRAMAHALEDLTDDTLENGHEGWKADSMVMRIFAQNLCMIGHTAGIPWEDFLGAMKQSWDNSRAAGEQLHNQREELIAKVKAAIEKDEQEQETKELSDDEKKDVN